MNLKCKKHDYSILISRFLLLLVLTLLATTHSYGQEQTEKISTGRPDLTQGTSTVPFKTFQIETGFTFWKDREGQQEIKSYAYPEVMVRIGLLKGFELRLQSMVQDSIIKENNVRRKVGGVGPLSAGFRVQLWKQIGFLPQVALQTNFTLPVGSKDVSPEHVEPLFVLVLSNELNQNLELTYNVGYSWVAGEPQKNYGVNLTADLADKLIVYIEAFGEKQREETAAYLADMGVLFLIRNNLQLDIGFGTSLNKEAPDYFLTTGISIRLPR